MPVQNRKPYPRRKFQRRKKFHKPGAKKATFRQIRGYGVKPDPFPTRLHTRCKYAGSLTLTSDGTTARKAGGEKVFRLNSIKDPDFSGSGTTVVGHAQLAALYGTYMVKGAKVEVSFSNPSHDGVVCFASLNQKAVLQSNMDSINYMNSLVYSSDINNTGAQTKRFNFYVKPWSLLGLSKLEWMANKSTHSADMSTSPTDPCYIRVACSGATLSSTIHVSIKIIYYVELFNRLQLAADVVI